MLRGSAPVLLLLLLGSAGCLTYQPGAFAHGVTVFTGEKATLGCLDVAVERREDHDKSAVLAYKFGNRCEQPQTVDLGSLRVIGRDAAGAEHALRPFDPRYQIRPLALDARLSGGEAIAYVAEDDVGVELVQVCVDAGGLVAGHSRWMCFAKQVEVPKDEPEAEPEEPAEPALVHEEAA